MEISRTFPLHPLWIPRDGDNDDDLFPSWGATSAVPAPWIVQLNQGGYMLCVQKVTLRVLLPTWILYWTLLPRRTHPHLNTHTLDITLTSSKIEKYGIGPSPIGKLSWNWNLKMFMHVPSIPGWLNAMDEGAGWSPFQWLRSVSEVPDGHLFTSTSSLHILRPVPRLLHFGPTGDVFERLRDGYICSTTWPSLLVALCHQIFSPAGVLGKFLTGTRNDDLNVCQQS